MAEKKPSGSQKPPPYAGSLRGFLRATLREIVSQRKWALLPLWVLLAIIAVLLILTGHPELLPVIYMAF